MKLLLEHNPRAHKHQAVRSHVGMTLANCAICDGSSSAMREHCPYCGARRFFVATHSFERYRVVVTARDCQTMGKEMVRAFSTTFCSDERAIVDSPADFEG